MCSPFSKHIALMRQALVFAKNAFETTPCGMDEVPVGAVLVDQKTDKILHACHNRTKAYQSPLAHAEIQALEIGMQQKGAPFLTDCTLYVTLEPCPLCAAALSFARIGQVVFGAFNPKGGAIVHGPRLFESPSLSYHPPVIGGVLETECAALLKRFFRQKRGAATPNTEDADI